MSFTESTYQTIKERDPRAAAQYAGRARVALAKQGTSLPAWIAAIPARAPRKPPAARPVLPQHPEASSSERALTAAAQMGQAFPVELTRWRVAGGVSRIVAIGANGVVQLVEYPDGATQRRARFQTVAEAIAGVTSNAIAWRPVHRVKAARRDNGMRLGASGGPT